MLFLDAPTTGLDPGSRAGLWDLVRRLRDEHGTIVLLTTHHLDEADALSDRLVVVDQGVVVAEGTPSALKREHAGSADASLQDAFLALTGRRPSPADATPLTVRDTRRRPVSRPALLLGRVPRDTPSSSSRRCCWCRRPR